MTARLRVGVFPCQPVAMVGRQGGGAMFKPLGRLPPQVRMLTAQWRQSSLGLHASLDNESACPSSLPLSELLLLSWLPGFV